MPAGLTPSPAKVGYILRSIHLPPAHCYPPSMSRNISIMSTMMIIRYDVRPDDEGWTIYDRRTDEPALVEDEQIVGLPKRDAEEIADMLNTLALMQGQQTMH